MIFFAAYASMAVRFRRSQRPKDTLTCQVFAQSWLRNPFVFHHPLVHRAAGNAVDKRPLNGGDLNRRRIRGLCITFVSRRFFVREALRG